MNTKIIFDHVKPIEETEYWAYYPSLFSSITFEEISQELQSHCVTYYNKIYGKTYEAKRLSCVIGNQSIYGSLPTIDWNKAPIVNDIKKFLDSDVRPNFDIIHYVLAHIYRTGTDREALSTPVISITFAPQGITRKFRFREIGKKSGWVKEFQLGHGDLLVMKKGCQRKYKHSVPVEKTISNQRINLTFRYNDIKGKKNPTNTQSLKNHQTQIVTKIPIGLKSKIPIVLKSKLESS